MAVGDINIAELEESDFAVPAKEVPFIPNHGDCAICQMVIVKPNSSHCSI